MSPASPSSTTGLAFPQATLYVLCSCVTFFWLGKVNSVVPEPYLDEVFHVRQAQAYWAGKWTAWDPKITTPPGLYLWSYSLARLFRAVSPSFELDAAGLRTTNALVNAAILPAFVRSLLRLNWMQIGLANIGKKSSRLLDNAEWILSHVTLNICLFPPLFFFSGLYYTDLLSALMVLAAYTANEYIQRQRDIKRGSHSTEFDAASLIASITLWTSGLFSLLFRQTNIFWVSVYLGGMHVIRTAKRCSKECKSSGFSDVISSSWHDGQVYDPPINGAGFEDYLKAGLSVALATLTYLSQAVPGVVPYLSFLVAFIGFVVWNGSVVLGHKEYHSASLHLPQMLYIWPYIAFFSWPLMLPSVVNSVLPQKLIPEMLRNEKARVPFPRLRVAIPVLLAMLLTVRFNTIVHPFTLADNRHYVFYVFRILRRQELVKYLATPFYLMCGWLAIATLGSPAIGAMPTEVKNSKAREKELRPGSSPMLNPNQESSNRVSVVIVWFLSTALSLITAPLVEPRYFIIPWIIWRLHVFPEPRNSKSRPQHTRKTTAAFAKLSERTWSYDHRLWLETLWYLTVNFVTGYVFLYKGFSWPQEPGHIQRFLW